MPLFQYCYKYASTDIIHVKYRTSSVTYMLKRTVSNGFLLVSGRQSQYKIQFFKNLLLPLFQNYHYEFNNVTIYNKLNMSLLFTTIHKT